MKATLRIHLAWVMLLVSGMPLLAQTRIDSGLRNSAKDGPDRPGLKTRPAQSSAERPLKPAHVVEKSDARARVGAAATVETFNFSGSIVTWTVPANVYQLTIEARGAEGGNDGASDFGSGQGASITGTVAVTPGDVLKILVGQQATENGGGGGTFVTTNTNNPLVIAGGGGGSGDADSAEKQGQAGTAGGAGVGGGAGGTAGNGGRSGRGGGGGGLLTDGEDIGPIANPGGEAFVNGGNGGSNGFGDGGFGGGGAGSGWVSGGGGGGYSGGGGAGLPGSDSFSNEAKGTGGGGGSFNGGTNQTNTAGANSGNGLVTITYTDISCGSNGQNVLICYYGTTQCVSKKTAERYLKLGATMGPCGTGNARLGYEPEAADAQLAITLQAFPNPVQDLVTLEVRAPQAGPTTFSVLDLTGRTRQSRAEELTEGLNEVEFRLGSLPTGTYLIRAIDALGRQGTTRVTKQ